MRPAPDNGPPGQPPNQNSGAMKFIPSPEFLPPVMSRSQFEALEKWIEMQALEHLHRALSTSPSDQQRVRTWRMEAREKAFDLLTQPMTAKR